MSAGWARCPLHCGAEPIVPPKAMGVLAPTAGALDCIPNWSHVGFSPQTAVLLLRIDDIVSGHKKKGEDQSKQPPAPEPAQE